MRYISILLVLAILFALPVVAAEDCTADKVTIILLPRDGISLCDAANGSPVDDFALTEAGAAARAAANTLLDATVAIAAEAAHCCSETARYTAALVGVALTVDEADLPHLRAAGDLAPAGSRFDIARATSYLTLEGESVTPIEAEDVTPTLTVDVTASPMPTAGDGTVIAILDGAFDPDAAWLTLPEGTNPALTGDALTARLALIDRAPLEAGQNGAKVPFLYNYVNPDRAMAGDPGHGTAVAALAGAASGDEYDGSAPGAQLLLLQIADDTALFGVKEELLLTALDDALLLGADVINLSLGFPSGDGGEGVGLARAVAAAQSVGVGIVAAAGNFGEVGRGSFFYNHLGEALFPMAYPDRGTLASPASLPGVIAVGAASGSYTVPTEMTLADGSRIPYSDTCADFYVSVESGVGRSFAELMGEKPVAFVAVPGIGAAADYVGLNVTGRIAVVARGELSFVEKTQHAAEAGAIGVIIYDNDPETDGAVNMQLEGAAIPAVFVSIAAGEALVKANAGELTFPTRKPSARGMEAEGIPDFSSRGFGDDFTLAPNLVAPGEDFVGLIHDGERALLAGSSYAAPQVAGALAALIAELRTEGAENPLADAKALLQNAALPLIDTASPERSPIALRSQGAGLLDPDTAITAPLLLRGNDDGALTLTGAADTFTLTFTAENRTDAPLSVVLTPTVYGETHEDVIETLVKEPMNEAAAIWLDACRYSPDTPVWCTDGSLTALDAAVRMSGIDIAATGAAITLEPHETREISLAVTLDSEVYAAYTAVCPNGFTLEGHITATVGETALSLPWAVFCGDWTAQPILSPLAYADESQLYAGQVVSAPLLSGYSAMLGEMHGGDPLRAGAIYPTELAAFNPHGLTDPIYLSASLTRNAASHRIRVTNEAGEVVYTADGGSLRKAYLYEGVPVSAIIPLWDGSVTDNPSYICPDGRYTIALTLVGESGGEQVVEIGVTLDTTAPILADTAFRPSGNGYALELTFADGEYVRAVQVADRRGDLPLDYAALVSDPVLAAGRGATHTMSIDIPATAGQYLYITIVDYAYNVTVVRIDRLAMIDGI